MSHKNILCHIAFRNDKENDQPYFHHWSTMKPVCPSVCPMYGPLKRNSNEVNIDNGAIWYADLQCTHTVHVNHCIQCIVTGSVLHYKPMVIQHSC